MCSPQTGGDLLIFLHPAMYEGLKENDETFFDAVQFVVGGVQAL